MEQAVYRTLTGIKYGEPLGFVAPRTTTLTDNPAWDDLDTLVIFVELVERLLDGTVLGPFLSPPSSGFHCSPMFTVPKDANGRRIILNYFSPVGASVNEDIDKR